MLQGILPQIIANTCEGEGIEAQSKLIVGGKWWLLSQLLK